MDIHIAQSFINETSGEVATPAEYLDQLRTLERAVGRLDMTIVTLKGDLKVAKLAKEKAVADLRYAVSEAKVLFGKSSRRRAEKEVKEKPSTARAQTSALSKEPTTR